MFTISAAQNIVNIYSHSCVYRNGTEKIVVVVVMKKSYMKKDFILWNFVQNTLLLTKNVCVTNICCA